MFKKALSISCYVLLAGLLLNSCRKKDDKHDVEFEYSIPMADNMEIDVLKVDTFIERESTDFPTMLDGELSKNNTSKDKVKSAKLVFMRIQVLENAYQDSAKYGNLRDISEIELYIRNDNGGRLLVARKTVPDVYTRAINMDLQDVELKDYLLKNTFRFIIRYKKRRAMPNEMPFAIPLKFKVVASPL